MTTEFRQKLVAFAGRAVALAPRCSNEEATKLFLVLPFLSLLGYDDRNPDEVCPEHGADFSEKYKNRVDFAILQKGSPVIAIECKTVGMALKDERGQLRSYFNAAPTVKMGLITDGIVFEFYADSDEPNMMDQTAFLTFDLREIAKGKLEDSVEEGVRSLQKIAFDPENIGAEAKKKLIFQNFVGQISRLAEEPSEPFVRILLQNAGLSNVRLKGGGFTDLVKSAFKEFVNVRILQRLDLPVKEADSEKPVSVAPPSMVNITKTEDGIVTTDTELMVYQYVKRRLAFLIKDEAAFGEIEHIEYRDYKGKFVLYYRRERSGRLFDFHEGKQTKFIFNFGADAGGEIATNSLQDIDTILVSVFNRRLHELAAPARKGSAVGTSPEP